MRRRFFTSIALSTGEDIYTALDLPESFVSYLIKFTGAGLRLCGGGRVLLHLKLADTAESLTSNVVDDLRLHFLDFVFVALVQANQLDIVIKNHIYCPHRNQFQAVKSNTFELVALV